MFVATAVAVQKTKLYDSRTAVGSQQCFSSSSSSLQFSTATTGVSCTVVVYLHSLQFRKSDYTKGKFIEQKKILNGLLQ